MKRRAMTTENARRVKLAGHKAEKEFADLIGGQVYLGTNKKDVLDKQGNIHSIKSGDKKWQIFLYGKNRFENSISFLGAKFFLDCITCFPDKFKHYFANKQKYKLALQNPMEKLKDFLSESGNNHFFIHDNKIIFIQESLFHNNEVGYLTIKDGKIFHIFDSDEVIRTFDKSTTTINSKATQIGQIDNQKVLFKLIGDDSTIGEIEMRNDSEKHYKQIKFWMSKGKTLNLLKREIRPEKKLSERIVTYGKAIRRFKL